MAEPDHLARTSAYFDGALPASEHAEVLAHLEGCAACQQHLRDAATFDAVLSEAPAHRAGAARRRWPLAVAGALAIAAAVVLYFVVPRGGAEPTTPVATLELPGARAVEARFSGERFGAYRPLDQLRGDVRREAITLSTLAELEKRGDTPDLIAALVASGDLTRAQQLVATLPATPAADADRAAVALASGDAEQALRFAYRAIDRDPSSVAAWWNLALASRQLDLWSVSRDAFQHVIDRGEPGWTDEGRLQVARLDSDLERHGTGFHAFVQRATAMVQGGTPITLDDVRTYPTYARLYLLDALRTGIDLAAVRPLATELDRLSNSATMTAAVERVAAANPAVRTKFAGRYRAVVARTVTPQEITALLGALRTAGRDVDDIRVGTIVQSGAAATLVPELETLTAPWHDPWFELYITREKVRAQYPIEDTRAEAPLRAALDDCANDAWALRCGQLAYDLADRYVAWGREVDAEHWAAFALRKQVTAAFPGVSTARSLLADIHRHLGRTTLARAELEEVVRSAPTCDAQRYAQIGLANVALVEDQWTRVRAALPPAVPPEGCTQTPDLIGLSTAVDLARHTGDTADESVARAWIETSTSVADGGLAAVGTLRIARGADPAATRAVETWLAAHRDARDPLLAGIRTWAVTTLISDAGARKDWAAVVAAATAERAAPSAAPCTAVASFDDGVITAVIRTAAMTGGEQRRIAQDELATTRIFAPVLTDQLAGCEAVAVNARPPLHGRSDLLPAALPWAFVGDQPTRPAVAGPARSVDVSDARPPDPSLPRLAPAAPQTPFDTSLTGAQATPARVLAALAAATYAELHVHGVAAAANDDATYLALSPDLDGTFALRADAVRASRLARGPVVVLAACRAGAVAPYLRERWSLPDAFVAAGASAVVAADIAIPDDKARRVFDDLHRRVLAGEPIERAVAAIRAAASGETAWAAHLMVFR